MTLTERARQIDAEEFAAECDSIRARAFALLERKPTRDARVERSIAIGYRPTPAILPPASSSTVYGRIARRYEAFGKSQCLDVWAIECGISAQTIRKRINRGWTLVAALSTPVREKVKQPHGDPGAASELSTHLGTGGRGTLHDTSEITFSKDSDA